jgi:transketolase
MIKVKPVKSAHLSRKLFKKSIDMVPTRFGYGDGLVEAGKKDENVVALCCDLTDSTKTSGFAKAFPERYFELGVAEQNMAGVAAGLALEGKVPFIASYAVFSPGRNWDQIRISICYSKTNVKIAGAHAGISVGPDGATHQALEDIATMRVLPNMTVICPCDAEETRKATIEAAKLKGPVYLRFGRAPSPVFTTKKTPFKIGVAQVFLEGSDVTVVACSQLVYEAMLAAYELAKVGVSAEVINLATIKPFDSNTILKSVKKTGAVVTVEEHQKNGGLGGAVAEALSENMPTPMERVGVNDRFGESGTPSELLEAFDLTHPAIIKKINKVLKRKK